MLLIDARLRAELERSEWRLQALVADAVRRADRVGYHVKATCVERTPERTELIYRMAGQKPPASSVHDVRPCRGFDAILLPAVADRDAGEDWALARDAGRKLADDLSAAWRYPRGKRSALYHAVSGEHLHLQVPFDELLLVA